MRFIVYAHVQSGVQQYNTQIVSPRFDLAALLYMGVKGYTCIHVPLRITNTTHSECFVFVVWCVRYVCIVIKKYMYMCIRHGVVGFV